MHTPSLNGELKYRVYLCLTTAKHAGLRELAVEANHETVILSGAVDSFYEKQLAQEMVRHVAGVRLVVNLMELDQRELHHV